MYKNWKAICKIEDTQFMLAFALLNLETEFGKTACERFPEYFSDEEQLGPVPLSALKATAWENNDDGHEEPEKYLISYRAIPEDWPIINFGDADTLNGYRNSGFQLIPEELKEACSFGKIYKWGEKELVLMELNYTEGEEWWFVPAELVDVDK